MRIGSLYEEAEEKEALPFQNHSTSARITDTHPRDETRRTCSLSSSCGEGGASNHQGHATWSWSGVPPSCSARAGACDWRSSSYCGERDDCGQYRAGSLADGFVHA